MNWDRSAFRFFFGALGAMSIWSGLVLADNPPPKGFEDPAVLEKVMGGAIVQAKEIDTPTESKVILKAFANKVSTDAYIDISVNHAKYPALFPEIQDAKTTKVNEEKTSFTYWSDMIIQQSFFTFHVYPEGVHTITRAVDPTSEGKIEHHVTNYKDELEVAKQTTRLIPYQNGILIEDAVHVKVAKPGMQANLAKAKMVELFASFIEGFRKELGGDRL